jgi:hypothetical protein
LSPSRSAAVESPVEFLGRTRPFREVNLLEQDAASRESPVLRLGPHEIKTIKLQIIP